MDKITLGFLALVIILVVAHFIRVEAFGLEPGSGTVTYNSLIGIDVSGIVMGAGYDANGKYVGVGGVYDAMGNYVGNSVATPSKGGYDANGNYIGAGGTYDMYGNFIGSTTTMTPSYTGGYDANGNYVGTGGMYDVNGSFVGTARGGGAARGGAGGGVAGGGVAGGGVAGGGVAGGAAGCGCGRACGCSTGCGCGAGCGCATCGAGGGVAGGVAGGGAGGYDANANYASNRNISRTPNNPQGSDGTINGLPAGTAGLPRIVTRPSVVIDNSGQVLQNSLPSSYINLSISDLLALIGKTTPPPLTQPPKVSYNYGMNAWASPVIQQQINTTPFNHGLINRVSLQPRLVSPAASQGADFLKYQYGMNPADYIRKDSIPCYGCTLPA